MLDTRQHAATVSSLSTDFTEPRAWSGRFLPRLRGNLPGGLIACAVAAGAFSSSALADEYQFGAARVTFDGVDVVFHNDLTSAADFPREFSFDLTEGITVQVIILHGAGNTPDMMVVIPPAGYVAVPEQVTVEEYDAGIISIYGGMS
jgi:hypothetical protein